MLECARRLSVHVSRERRANEAERKADYIDTYIPFIGEALQEMLQINEKQKDAVINQLRKTLEKGKLDGKNKNLRRIDTSASHRIEKIARDVYDKSLKGQKPQLKMPVRALTM